MAEPTGAVPIGIFHSANPTRIRTLRCAENPPWCPVAPSIQRQQTQREFAHCGAQKTHHGAQSHLPFSDTNEDSHHSMRRTPLWCPSALFKRRRQREFAPIDAQNATLVSDRKFHASTSTRICTHRCAEHHSGAQSHISILRRQRGFAPFDAQNATLVADRKFLSSTSTRIRTHRCAERHSGARPHLPWNIFPRHPGSWVALFRPA